MAKTDPRNLRPVDLARALNSTALGEVTSERQLYRHRIRAGYRIGDGRHIDMVRYAAWLVDELEQRHAAVLIDPKASYEAQKARAGARNADLARAGQEIGEIPAVVDPERKARATGNFRFFCETYFPEIFYLPWSPDHHRVIDKIERAVLNGGLFAMAMPRGSGKTVLCQTAVVWAALIGATPFVCLIAASADRAVQLLETIKTWLETNPLLLEDWPEVVFAIRSLERITNRQKGQKYRGEPTRIEWNADKIVLPTIAGSRASGVVISCSGMKGSDIRGQNHARADGHVVRPQLALVDDPQTTESAWSPSQSQRREAILAGDVLGMAGPGKKIAGLMCATVIRPADMADNMLDRQKHPEWQGERTKLVYAFPVNEKLWAQYAQTRADSQRNDGDGHEATDFYAAHREEMDAGAVVAWPERYNDDELSAIQHAMNLKLRDEASFFAEYQNEPLVQEEGSSALTADEVAAKVNSHRRGEIPLGASHLTMFVDVQARLLFYMVAAWEDDFTGYVVDYGTWPDQHRPYFTLRDARKTLEAVSPQAGVEGSIYSGLEALTGEYMSRSWRREDGAMLKIDRCLIDANWGQSTDVVYQFSRQSVHSGILLPSHGKYVGATSTPFSEYKRRKGDRIGLHWRIPNVQGRRQVRYVLIDTNYWKSFVHARLAVAMGDKGCLSLFGRGGEEHRLLAEHLTAEYPVRAEARGRTVDEWKVHVNAVDNHWLDCLVGCAVAASVQGAVLFGTQQNTQGPSKKVRLSVLQAARTARA